MTHAIEDTHRTAELALAALRQMRLPATPRNIEVWCIHIAGQNPALSRDIQRFLEKEGEITQPRADALHRDHVMRADLAKDIVDIVARFQEEVDTLHDVIETSGENTRLNTDRLGDLSGQLQRSAGETPAVRELLENVLAVTKAVKSENQKLASQLAESSGEVANLQRNVERIRAEAVKDPLTGIANRREFDNAMNAAVKSAKSENEPLALIMADIDYFKTFNDRWGHQTGDQVLRLVAEVMDANVKGRDLLARYGGEEFAILLPETTLVNAQMLADRIRQAIEQRRLKKRRTNEDLGVITMSMGVAVFAPDDTVATLIERADECLYAAKKAGRNRVIGEDNVVELASQAQSDVA